MSSLGLPLYLWRSRFAAFATHRFHRASVDRVAMDSKLRSTLLVAVLMQWVYKLIICLIEIND